jgi:hypothetical protein
MISSDKNSFEVNFEKLKKQLERTGLNTLNFEGQKPSKLLTLHTWVINNAIPDK